MFFSVSEAFDEEKLLLTILTILLMIWPWLTVGWPGPLLGLTVNLTALLRRGAHTLFGLSMPEQRGK